MNAGATPPRSPGVGRRGWLAFGLAAVLSVAATAGSLGAASADAASPSGGTHLLVTYRAGTTSSGRAGVIAGAHLKTGRRIAALGVDIIPIARTAAAAAIARLRSDPTVARVELDKRIGVAWVPATDPEAVRQWSLLKTNVNHAWDLSTGSGSVVIGVIDTGVRPDEPDLAGRLVAGYDFVDGDSTPLDGFGHGTTVSTTIAANRSDGIGVAGVCPSCRVMPVRVLGNDGYGLVSNVALGIVYAVDHGASIVNLSLGSSSGSAVEADAIAYAIAHGVVVVAAAGNEGTTAPFYPAAYPGVISVGAVDFVDRRMSWSSYGSWVSMVAPGCVQSHKSTTEDGVAHYAAACGTSFAAPQVAGVAGLLRSVTPNATIGDLRAALTGTTALGVVQPDGSSATVAAKGRLDAAAAVDAIAGDGSGTSLATDAAAFPVVVPGETVSTSIRVTDVWAMAGIRTTSLRTVVFHLQSDTGADFDVVVRDGTGYRRAIGHSTGGRYDRTVSGLYADAYTIDIRPIGADSVTVVATAAIEAAPPVEPLTSTVAVSSMTDSTVTVDAAVAGGLPGYALSTWLTAWQMVERSLDATGTTTFTFDRSCVTDMHVAIRVVDQDGHGTKAVSNTLTIPRATGCPAAPFTVAGTARSVELVDPASMRLELGGAPTIPGDYFYQWHGAGADRAIEAFLPDPDLAWYGALASPTIPCAVLAGGHVVVLIAYSQVDTRIAATSAPLVLPACAASIPAIAPAPGDHTPPVIVGRSPRGGSTGIDRDQTLRIRVNERVKGIAATTVRLVNLATGRTVRLRTLRFDSATKTVILDPYYRMSSRTRYRVVIRSGVHDIAGNPLMTQTWTFRTGRR
jgi:subtilisin family serine protease